MTSAATAPSTALTTAGPGNLIEKFNPAIAAGLAIVVSVEAIRERFGDRWPRKHEQVDAFVLRTTARLAGASAMIAAVNDVEFIIIQPNVEPLVGLNFAAAILKETLTFFLGQVNADDIRIFKVAGWDDGKLTLEPVRHDSSPHKPAPPASVAGATNRAPFLRELSFARAKSVTLAPEGARPLVLEFAIEAVWNVNQRVVTSYAMLPHLTIEATGEDVAVSALSRDAALAVALEALGQAAAMIVEGMERSARFAVHVPVPLQGIMAVSKRHILLHALNDLSAEVRKLLALDLCGQSEGVPHSRMSELVTALAPACRAVLARAPSPAFKVQEWRGCRLSGISLDCSGLGPGDPHSLTRLASFAEEAGKVTKTIIGHSLATRSLTLAAWAAGFSHLSGETIRPALERPDAVRWTPNDLYRERVGALARTLDDQPEPHRRKAAAGAAERSAAGEPDVVPWLRAMDGVAYLVDSGGVIVGAGGVGWCAANERLPLGPVSAPEALIGLNLFEQISGESVRDHYRLLHKRAFKEIRPQITFEYRCDAPDIKRTMRMSIGRLERPGHEPHALYQSQILSAVERPWMSVFEPLRIIEALGAESQLPIIAMCSICERVAWPVSPATEPRAWIQAEEYYQRCGEPDVRVRHTVCETCAHTFSTLLIGPPASDAREPGVGSGGAPALSSTASAAARNPP